MRRLYLPDKNDGLLRNAALDFTEGAESFKQKSEDIEKRAEEMVEEYTKNPSSVQKSDVKALAVDTYKLAIELFDAKKAGGEALLPQEQEIYDLCRQEVSKSGQPQPLNSIYGALFNAIELVRNCIDQVKDWFGISSERDKAGMSLVNAGDVILPSYAGILKGFFTTIEEMFMPIFTPTVIGVAEAQAECALRYQETRTVNKTLASSMLDLAGYAYEGHSGSGPNEYVKLAAGELPPNLRVLYNEEKGLLTSSRGLQVWLGKKDNYIAVSYAGTDPTDVDMLYADVIQLSAPSVLYLKAAGLLKLLLDHIPDKNFYITGHSLGGGLAQFSAAANMNIAGRRLEAYGYNPAGLSMLSLRHLESSRLISAKSKVWIFMTCYDPVSAVGGKLGCLTTLPKTDKNGHGMSDLQVCMREYLKTPQPSPSSSIKVTFRNHYHDTDFIPYTRKLSLSDQNGKVYPLFNTNVSSESEAFIEIRIPEKLFSSLGLSTSASESCLGVYNKFNGTAHTVINRLLLLNAGGPSVSTASIGNIHSSIIYGKFGLGMQEFIPLLEKAYADSGESFAGSRMEYEKVLSMLNNPLTYDKAAWCDGISLEFGIDMNAVFSRWPLAESYFDLFLTKITSERIDIYRALYTGGKPSKDRIVSFLGQFKQSVLKYAEELMNEAVRWGIITQGDKANYLSRISNFSDRVIAAV